MKLHTTAPPDHSCMSACVISDGAGVLEMMTLYDKDVEVDVKNP